jgi:MATE family multidrug resistance protein
MVILYLGFGTTVIGLMTTDPAVRAAATLYLPWVVALPLTAVWCYHLDGIFIGATWTPEMRNGMAISTVIFILCLLLTTPVISNHGLWLSFHIFVLARAATLAGCYGRLERRIGN